MSARWAVLLQVTRGAQGLSEPAVQVCGWVPPPPPPPPPPWLASRAHLQGLRDGQGRQ